ncbi:MAG: AMP-binding protein [Pseudomonadota bacterium]
MSHVTDMAAKRAELTPERAAFIDHGSGRAWSFAEVEAAAAGLAGGLLGMGLAPGDRVAILCLNRTEFFVTLFACQKAGLILAPLNWRQPPAELGPVIDSVGVAAIVFDGEFVEAAQALAGPRGLRRVALDCEAEAEARWEELAAGAPAPARRVPEDEAWYLLFTSGTTGLPKAVIQTARMGWASAVNTAQAIGLVREDRTVNFLPLFHTAGINLHALPVFLWGGVSHVLPRFEPGQALDLISKGEVTQFFGVPAIYQAFSLSEAVDGVDFSAVRSFACGGAPLPEPLIRFFAERGATVRNGFGMTETGPTVFLMDAERAEEKIGSVGQAQMLTEARLDGVPDGDPGEGELLVRGPNITPGYFGAPDATAAAFTEDGFLRTGDVARRDADGCWFIVDRIKDMYISGGENVYPAEVERVLNQHPDVLESAVIGVPDETWGEVGAAYLMPRPGRAPDLDALGPWCRERLAAYKIPKRFELVEDFPRTAAGKIRKPELRERGRG